MFKFDFLNNRINSITECNTDDMYDRNKLGFYRRVNMSSFFSSSRPARDQVFEDRFTIDFNNNLENPNGKFKPRRLFNVYEKEDKIFKNYTEDQ